MTRTGYILAKTLATFGVAPLEKYRTNAATENHLLRDSELMVGELTWSYLENIEDVSSEYWKLRKLSKREGELDAEIEKLTNLLDSAQESRAQALEEVAQVTRDKVIERDKAAESVDRLHQERDDIQRDGRSIKRAHSGLKTKLEVLLEEDDSEKNPEVEATRRELREKRTQFEAIKTRRDEIDARISELQERLKELNSTIEKENDAIREKAEQQFSTIGKTNKDLTTLRNKVGQIETEKKDLCIQVGRFVIERSKDSTIQKAVHKYRGLLSLIEQVRGSSMRHRKILGI